MPGCLVSPRCSTTRLLGKKTFQVVRDFDCFVGLWRRSLGSPINFAKDCADQQFFRRNAVPSSAVGPFAAGDFAGASRAARFARSFAPIELNISIIDTDGGRNDESQSGRLLHALHMYLVDHDFKPARFKSLGNDGQGRFELFVRSLTAVALT